MKVYSLPDITCTGSAVAVSATSQPCKWYRVFGVSIAAAAARVGDSTTTLGTSSPVVPAAGSPVTATVPYQVPAVSPPASECYDLKDVYVAGTNGDKVSVEYAI